MFLPLPTKWKVLSQKYGGKVLIFTSYLLILIKGKGTFLVRETGEKMADYTCSDQSTLYFKPHEQIKGHYSP